jgi:hypothetical protein
MSARRLRGHSQQRLSRPVAQSAMANSGVVNPRLMRSSSSARQAASLSRHASWDCQQHLLAVRAHAERQKERDRGRASVEGDTDNRAVEDQPSPSGRAFQAPTPKIEIGGLALAPAHDEDV